MRNASYRLAHLLLILVGAVGVGAGLLAPVPARAFAPSGVPDPVPLDLPPFLRADLATESAFRNQPGWRALAAEAGEEPFRLILDARTGAPGILRLTLPLVAEDGREVAIAARDAAIAFVARHSALLQVDPSTLTLDPQRGVTVLLDGRLILVDFAISAKGIPVEGARLSLRIVRGNLVMIETERLVDCAPLDATPLVTADSARATALARLGLSARDVSFEAADSLRFLPRSVNGELTARLAWKLRFAQARSLAGWEAWVDAHDGSVLALFDASHYDCPPPAPGSESRVLGGILPSHPADAEVVRGIPYARLTLGGPLLNTNFGGDYLYPGGAGNATFAAPPGFATCVTCSNPTTGAAPVDSATGNADFGVGGSDLVGNGISIKSERTAFYHLCRVHDFARKWLPQAQVRQDIELRVNTSSFFTCNAAWRAPAIYLLPQGGGCVNSGEHPGIVQHEWGHALDSVGGPGGDWGEGMADHLAWLTNRQSKVAPGFSQGIPDTLLREMDEDLAATLRVWPMPECGGEVHCLGEGYGQADWHLCRLLRQDPRFGEETGWHLAEAIFFLSEPQAGSLAPDTPGSIYEAYANTLESLFGDGNLAAGVPLASFLNAAYSHHGMAAASPYSEETYPCAAPPSAPVPTVQVIERDAVTGHPKVTLTWADPVGVAHDVVRSDDGANYSKLLLATVPAGTTTFTDAQVILGARYHYVIIPHLASRCYPLMDVVTEVLVQSGLSLASADIDLSGDGSAAPGETFDIVPHVRNDAAATLTAAVAVLQPGDPRATILQDTSTVGTLVGGATNTGTAWRVQLANDPALCGQMLSFPVQLTAAEGCWPAMLSFVVGGTGAIVPAGDALRVSRSGDDATLDWSLSASTSTLFRVYRRVSLRQLPPTGAMALTADSVAARTWSETDGTTSMPLSYYVVKALDACGNEEP